MSTKSNFNEAVFIASLLVHPPERRRLVALTQSLGGDISRRDTDTLLPVFPPILPSHIHTHAVMIDLLEYIIGKFIPSAKRDANLATRTRQNAPNTARQSMSTLHQVNNGVHTRCDERRDVFRLILCTKDIRRYEASSVRYGDLYAEQQAFSITSNQRNIEMYIPMTAATTARRFSLGVLLAYHYATSTESAKA